ncbi:TIGR02301 family protein [Prosthecomicrobium sp. N25]|uniref:TIGR02301 family protein n=1 Tax=Prosthecomicrobium sp. N25 TaxID=3129254 RepID=UPI003076A978
MAIDRRIGAARRFRGWTAGLLALGLAELAATPAAGAAPGEPPYVDQILRLAEIMGALHHLRPLCGANEPQVWRQKMSALLAAEDPGPEERRRIVDRFNQSYRSLSEIYRTCTPAASEIIDRYLAEGSRISREIVVRYGRP